MVRQVHQVLVEQGVPQVLPELQEQDLVVLVDRVARQVLEVLLVLLEQLVQLDHRVRVVQLVVCRLA